MNKNPLVSIIILNFNGKKFLQKCLESLMKVSYQDLEIIVVDNNSNDGSIKYVNDNFSSVKIIELKKNLGFAEPNNIGAKKANGEFLLFLNNDTWVDTNFLTELVRIAQEDETVAILQPLLLKPDGQVDSSGDYVDIHGRAYRSKAKPKTVQNILSARGAAMLIKKEIFWNLNGFDPKFFVSFEDVDIGWRAWLLGYRVVVVPTSIVYHIGGQTTKKIESEIKFHGIKNNLVLRLSNFESSNSIKTVITFFVTNTLRKIFGVSVMKEREAIETLPSFTIIFKSLSWIIKNSNYISKKSEWINSKRVRSTNDLIDLGVITKD